MKKRIIIWVICLAVSFGYIAINEYQKSLPAEEIVESAPKDTLYIYNHADESESVVKKVFDNTNLSSTNELKFVNSDRADCILTRDLALLSDDDKTILTSYTPLIIGMKNSQNLQEYKKSGLLISSKEINNSVEDEISIDFKKIIDAVVNGDNWSVFGGEDKEIRIVVPKKDSIEGKLFYNFLLVTINNGSYPTNDEALQSAKATANSFLQSSSCVETENVINELKKISSINATDMYVLFEADFINSSIWSEKNLDISLVYPSVTLVRHMYIQVEEEQEEFSKFFSSLSTELNYRNSSNYSFTETKNYNVKDDMTFVEVPNAEENGTNIGEIVFIMFILMFVIMIVIIIAIEIFG